MRTYKAKNDVPNGASWLRTARARLLALRLRRQALQPVKGRVDFFPMWLAWQPIATSVCGYSLHRLVP